jgi:predicted nucleic acid-binding protein
VNFVLDSSLTMAFVLQDETTAETDEILDSLGQGSIAFTPALWRWEVANVLLTAERRKRITPDESHQHLSSLQSLPVELDDNAWREAWNASLLLARKHQLSLHDAAYLELAIRKAVPLGSLDTDLRKAARSEGVKLLPEKI